MSTAFVEEIRDVSSRPTILAKNSQVTLERVASFLDLLARHGTLVEQFPHTMSLPRDPKDEPYLNLAIHAQASRG